MTLETWQTELRRQFGSGQPFQLENIGNEPIFSEFLVTNPQSKNTYRVAIRGTGPGDNFCACPDFATNALGTCKHVEFTLATLAKKRGGNAALKQGFQPQYSEVYTQYGPRREVRFRPGTDCPIELARLAAKYFDAEGKLLPEAFGRFDSFLNEASRYEHELRCYDDALSLVAQMRDANRRREILRQAFPRGIHSAAFKKLLKAPLYPYQREGALFAAEAGRALIGDEMGLGKTIQALACAEILARDLGIERVLIVCPTSLKHQWEREIEKFTARGAQVIGGLSAQRHEQFAAPSFFKITNYDTIHRDQELIQKWSPDLVILDEAQRIKNWNTRTARSVKRLASPYAVVLTGTPLENRLEELVSIVQFVDLFRLGPTYRLLDEHQRRDEHGRVVGYQNLDRIGATLKPILIRRHKSEVAKQLPPRLDKNVFVPMTPQQCQHHADNMEIVARLVSKWRRIGFLTESDQRGLMIALQNMRMSCDSTYLLDQQTDCGVKADELATLLDEWFERPDAKAVVFSQWVRMHELLVPRLSARNWDHVLFHGGVPTEKRKHLVDRFREDGGCRAFLATDAGGVGLNLQHANIVVNMDLPWNPAVLEQRIGRVHRLGQTQPVHVVNFIAQGTIEEGMLSVLSFKKSLFAGVLDGGEKDVFLGGSRLKKFMETVENVTGRVSPAVVEESSAPSSSDNRGATRVARENSPVHAETAPEAIGALESSLPVDPLSALVGQGVELLKQLVSANSPASGDAGARVSGSRTSGGPLVVARDEQTGGAYLRIQLPEPAVLDRALTAIAGLLDALRGK